MLGSKLAILAAAFAGNSVATPTQRAWRHKTEKVCPQCGKPHKHNNRWCSAQCCRDWREAQ